jgi:hypothetical protein
MKPLKSKRTLDSCIESASKFGSSKEWREFDIKSLNYAYRKGWYQECAKHFKK